MSLEEIEKWNYTESKWGHDLTSISANLLLLLFVCAAASKQQDGGVYKTPAYSGYPFLMLPDPYLPNGSVSPTVSLRASKKKVLSTVTFRNLCWVTQKKKILAHKKKKKNSLKIKRPCIIFMIIIFF